MAPVGSDDERCPDRSRVGLDTADPASLEEQPVHLGAGPDRGPCCLRRGHQQRVERHPAKAQRRGTEDRGAVLHREAGAFVDQLEVLDRYGADRPQLVEDAKVVEQPHDAWLQDVGGWRFTRKVRSVEYAHLQPAPREQHCEG
jgi:hypothetical protein